MQTTAKKVLTNHMPKQSLESAADEEREEPPTIKICCNCFKACTRKNHKQDFSRNRKVTNANRANWNRIMTKPRQRKVQIGESWCDKCDTIFSTKRISEERALSKKLDIEIEKKRIFARSPPKPKKVSSKRRDTHSHLSSSYRR
jgi:hypothetical protein